MCFMCEEAKRLLTKIVIILKNAFYYYFFQFFYNLIFKERGKIWTLYIFTF